MATCPRNEWVKNEIENLRGKITTLKDLINAMNEEVGGGRYVIFLGLLGEVTF